MFLFYTFVLHFNIDRTRFGLNVPLQLSLSLSLSNHISITKLNVPSSYLK